MKWKASMPFKANSGVGVLSEGQWKAIKRKLSVKDLALYKMILVESWRMN